MSTIQQAAQAFANAKPASCHNAKTDGTAYWLHGHAIAERQDNALVIDWCGWYTPTTANHMNNVLKALGIDRRVSYAQARNAGDTKVHYAL
ncbi:MAG: hypothetical protein ACRC1H_10030 [Caldilineaceae bacterium]